MHVRDAMHTFLEGITRMLGAYTMCMMVRSKWCTPLQLRRALLTFPFPVKDKPGFLPSKLFKLTTVHSHPANARSKTYKGPAKDSKLPYTAYITLIFTVFSPEFLRSFVPDRQPTPCWWSCWLLHVAIVRMMLKFTFTFDDLMMLEDLSLKCQNDFFSVEEYSHLWKPKWHWATHLAHDIFKYGPPRMLWCMIMEMKNREFKLACKRSNYHNPVKSTAEFWVDQAAYVVRKRRRDGVACNSSTAKVIGMWSCQNEGDMPIEIELLTNCGWFDEVGMSDVEYVGSVCIHGVQFCQHDFVLVGNHGQLGRLVHIMRLLHAAGYVHFAFLEVFLTDLQVNTDGGLYVPLSSLEQPHGHRLVSVVHVPLVAMWHFNDQHSNIVHLVSKW